MVHVWTKSANFIWSFHQTQGGLTFLTSFNPQKHEPTPFPIKLHHSFTTSKYQAYDCSVILCKTDPIKLNERLAQRYLYVNNLETSSIQDMKRFTESQKQILQRYEDLPSHLIDATIQTTSTRQAAIALQRLFTLDFGIFLTLPK